MKWIHWDYFNLYNIERYKNQQKLCWTLESLKTIPNRKFANKLLDTSFVANKTSNLLHNRNNQICIKINQKHTKNDWIKRVGEYLQGNSKKLKRSRKKWMSSVLLCVFVIFRIIFLVFGDLYNFLAFAWIFPY